MKIDLDIKLSCTITPTARAMQVLGPYDRKPRASIEHARSVSWEIPDDWSVLAIVGESMSGKTTLARVLKEKIGATMLEAKDAKGRFVEPFEWPGDRSLIDGFPEDATSDDVAGMLTSVGFASIPDWDKPYWALSAGGQFRVTLARALLEAKAAGVPLIIDEFASLVDPLAAQTASAALSKTARRLGLRVVCVGWRRDHLSHLEPDGIWDCDRQSAIPCFDADGRRLVRRPPVECRVIRTDREAWDRVFGAHHYLDASLHNQAQCFGCLIGDVPAGFVAVQHYPAPSGTARGKTWREHRIVVLPKFQGLGIGNALSEHLAAIYASTGTPYFSTTSHPGMIAHRRRHPDKWQIVRAASMRTSRNEGLGDKRASSAYRITESYRYIGPVDAAGARRLRVA